MATPEASGSLTTATAAGPGSTIDFTTAVSTASMILVSNGTITGGVVSVEASHDGTNWVKLDAYSPQTGFNQAFYQKGGGFRYWRANIIADIEGGGSVTATFMEAG
jgi:hypothetical protein